MLLSLIIFVLTFTALSIFQIKYALVLALIAGLTEFIPYLGPLIGAIPAVFLALFQSPASALVVIMIYVIIQQFENTVLVPQIMKKVVDTRYAKSKDYKKTLEIREKERIMNEKVDEKIFELLTTDYKYAYVQTIFGRGSIPSSLKRTKRLLPTYKKTKIENSICYDLEELRKEIEGFGIDYKNIGYRSCLNAYKIAKSNKM